MSGSELRRIKVLSEVLARKRTESAAAAVFGLSMRQARGLVRSYRDGGGGALINKARSLASNNQLIVGVREYIVELVSTRYADFGPTLAAEVLLENDGVKISRETLHKWMIEDGLWLSRRQRRSFGQQHSLAYDRRQIILERSAPAGSLAGQYVEIYDFSDGPLEVRWKGQLLPYRIFSKDQRVSQTAIAQNKRSRHARVR